MVNQILMNDKKQIAIHEAGHVVVGMLWDLPWEYAVLFVEPSGKWGGKVKDEKHETIEDKIKFIENFVPKDYGEFIIKDCSRVVAGIVAEDIYVGKNVAIAGQRNDLETFMMWVSSCIDEKFGEQFTDILLNMTHHLLTSNWNNVIAIADELHRRERIIPEDITPIKLRKPPQGMLAEIVKRIPWREQIN